MTPEQLQAIPGIGEKTVEKIFLAVNNYFSSLEAGEGTGAGEGAGEEPGLAEPLQQDNEAALDDLGSDPGQVGPDSAGQSGDTQELSPVAEANEESVEELAETGQGLEAEVVMGVEDAPDADVAEVTTHEEHQREKDVPPEKQ